MINSTTWYSQNCMETVNSESMYVVSGNNQTYTQMKLLHRAECLLFSGHLLPVCRSVIITRYAEKDRQSLVAVDAQRCSLI